MSESTVLSQLDVLFKNITEACNEEEKRQIVADLKERYQDSDAHQPDDLKETFHKLYLSGLITHEDLGILYHTAEKSLNKGKIVSHLDEFKRSQPLKSEALVGRSKEKQELLELLSDDTTHSVNIHGVPGVGKTTLAKHLAKELEQDSWETITFDLREAKDIDTAYLFILLTLGHTAVSRSYDTCMYFKDFRKRSRKAILGDVQVKCKKAKQLLLLFDNVQSELVKWRDRNELVCFFNAIIASQECQTGMLKIIVTSRVQIPTCIPVIRNYNLDPLPSSTSNNLICRRSKLDLQSEYLQDDEEALSKVADLCRNTPYLLQNAEHVLRNGFITSQELLQKIEAQKDKEVPDEYIITGTLFESLPTDNLKKLAVKLCVYTKPFSLSEVKEVADLKSEYDALLDLEFLTNHGMISKVITEIKTEDGLTQVKTEYEVHSLFKEFAVSYLRVQTPVYQDQAYNEAEVKFGDYFTEKLLKLVSIETKDPDAVAGVLEHDIDTFDDVLQIRHHNEKILKNLIHFTQQEAICRVTMFLESLKSNERLAILMTWADALENQGDLDSSTSVRCLGILCLIDMEGIRKAGPELDQATSALERTEEHINKISAKQHTDGEEREAANLKCLFHFCKGKFNYIKSLRNANEKKTFLQLAIKHFEEASKVNKFQLKSNCLAVELLKSLSDCQMELSNTSDATGYLKEAIDQLKLGQGEIDKPVLISLYNKLALLYGKLNDYLKAKSYLMEALAVHGKHDENIISNNLGILYQKVGAYSEAISSFQDAQNKWEELGDRDNIALVCKNFGSLYREQKAEYSRASSYDQKRALILKEKHVDYKNTALESTKLGCECTDMKDYNNAISNFKVALEMWKKLGDDSNTELVYTILCTVYMEMKDYDSAIAFFKNELDEWKKAGDNSNTAKVYRNLLNVYMEMKNYDSAIAFFKHELNEWKKLGDDSNTALAYTNLGSVCMEMKDYDRASYYFERARRVWEMLGDDSNTALVYTNLGSVCMEMKDYHLAKYYFERVRRVWEKLGDDSNTALAYTNLGSVYMEMKDYHRAKDYFERARHVWEMLGDDSNTAYVFRNLGSVYMEMKDYDRARDYFRKAQDAWKRLGDYSKVELLYLDLYNLHRKMGYGEEEGFVHQKQLEEELKMQEKELQQELQKQEVESHQDHDSTVIVDERGDTFSLSIIGVTLQIPEGALKQPTNLTVRKVSTDALPSPAEELDSVVSSIIQIGPKKLYLLKPINVTLKHYGPLHTSYYENVAMGYDDERNTWERIKGTRDSLVSDSSPSNSLDIQLTKLTTVTVVTRLITDTFEVPVSGCKVTSSVCPDVTLEFPQKTVEKLSNGYLKVLPMPEVLPLDVPQGLYFGPIIAVDGFDYTTLNEGAIITVPYPATCQRAGHERAEGQVHVHVMRYEDKEWKDVTETVQCLKGEFAINIRVKHFSKIWVCVESCVRLAVSTLLLSVNQLYSWLKDPPQPVSFFAFQFKNIDPSDILKILLALGADDDQILKYFKDSQVYQELTRISGQVDIYPNTVVKPRVEGGFQIDESNKNIHLRFNKDKHSKTELTFQERSDCDKSSPLILRFYSTQNKEEQVVGTFILSRGQLGLPIRIPASTQRDPSEDAFYIKNGLLVIIEIDTHCSTVTIKDRKINQIKTREGSSKDVEALTNTLVNNFGFVLKFIRNKSGLDICNELESISSESNQHDCCAVCIMSHGELDCFLDINSNKIEENKITSIIKKRFVEKPKLLFLQTCRTLPDQTTENRTTSQDQATKPENPLNDAEMLIGYSCCEGREAYRGEVSGTFFLQTLCEVFTEKFKEMDAESMLTEVNNRLLRKEPKQVCERKSTLSKKVYFTSVHQSDHP